MTRIGLYGVGGHMGLMLVREIGAAEGFALAGGCGRAGSAIIGADPGPLAGIAPLGLEITDDPRALCDASDVVVDYSAAAAAMALLPAAEATGTPLLIGSTGFDAAQQARLRAAGRAAPVLLGANMSLSVMAMYDLVRLAARRLGPEFDIEIFDFHPHDKIDAPSGTALELGRRAAEGRGVALEDALVPARHGETGARRPGDIGFASVRGGDVVGENTVYFAGPGQRLEIVSRVTDRRAFAGATLQAAAWLTRQPPGFYTMEDATGEDATRG